MPVEYQRTKRDRVRWYVNDGDKKIAQSITSYATEDEARESIQRLSQILVANMILSH